MILRFPVPPVVSGNNLSKLVIRLKISLKLKFQDFFLVRFEWFNFPKLPLTFKFLNCIYERTSFNFIILFIKKLYRMDLFCEPYFRLGF